MRMESLRTLALTLILAGGSALGAQAPPKAKAKPLDDARVKPEVATGSKVRSRQLKEQKKAAAPQLPPVNINTASREELMKLPGLTGEYADRIIAQRPYATKSRVVLSGAIPYAVFLPIKKQLTVSGGAN